MVVVHTREGIRIDHTGWRSRNAETARDRGGVAAFSTVARSLVLPQLARWRRAHPDAEVHLQTIDVEAVASLPCSTIAPTLASAPALRPAQELEHAQVFREEYVLTTSRATPADPGVFLDYAAEATP